jgi:RimJ/RimL family protein N-acetyltransferase
MGKTVNGRSDFADLSYRFLRKHWGKGYATEAAEVSLDYGFRAMGYPEICSYPYKPNLASQGVLKKLGMQRKNEFVMDGHTMVWFEKRNPDL